MWVCILLVLFSEIGLKIINLLLPNFEIVKKVQSTYVSFFRNFILFDMVTVLLSFDQGKLWRKKLVGKRFV